MKFDDKTLAEIIEAARRNPLILALPIKGDYWIHRIASSRRDYFREKAADGNARISYLLEGGFYVSKYAMYAGIVNLAFAAAEVISKVQFSPAIPLLP